MGSLTYADALAILARHGIAATTGEDMVIASRLAALESERDALRVQLDALTCKTCGNLGSVDSDGCCYRCFEDVFFEEDSP